MRKLFHQDNRTIGDKFDNELEIEVRTGINLATYRQKYSNYKNNYIFSIEGLI